MFSENLKTVRRAKGLTQAELAIRLNVVRQTVSKWEKGRSVPDADMLIQLADFLEVPVSTLLGAKIENEANENELATQLSKINEQLAEKNCRGRILIRILLGILIGTIAIQLLFLILGTVSFRSLKKNTHTAVTSQSESVITTP